jgi:hypothetical protein
VFEVVNRPFVPYKMREWRSRLSEIKPQCRIMIVGHESVGEFNVNLQFGRLVIWQDTEVLFVVYVVVKA